jgi:hypothetical protein
VFRQFILIGGDAALAISSPHRSGDRDPAASAYPGCYALSKVLEEVMAEQYGIHAT